MLSGVVENMISGRPVERNRLRTLSKMIENKSYWLADYAAPMLESLQAKSGWQQVYEDNKQIIRKAIHGKVGVTESRVTKDRYSKLPEHKLSEFTIELDESFQLMIRMLGEASARLNTLEIPESSGYAFSLDAVAKEIVSDVRSLEMSGKAVRSLVRDKDVAALAELHDRLADKLKELVIIEEFLVSMQPSPTPTEYKDATQS